MNSQGLDIFTGCLGSWESGSWGRGDERQLGEKSGSWREKSGSWVGWGGGCWKSVWKAAGRTGLVGVWGGRQDRGMLCASWGGAVQLGRGTFVRQLGRRE